MKIDAPELFEPSDICRFSNCTVRLSCCTYILGVVKKCGLLKIQHDKYKQMGRSVNPVISEFLNSFQEVKNANKEVENLLPKTTVG